MSIQLWPPFEVIKLGGVKYNFSHLMLKMEPKSRAKSDPPDFVWDFVTLHKHAIVTKGPEKVNDIQFHS